MMQGKMIGANIIYRILNVIVVFIINILISRLMGAAGYGLLSLLIANATIFNLISSLGADAGISYNTASGLMQPGRVLGFISGIVLFQLLLLALVEWISWLASGNLFLFKSDQLSHLWLGVLFLVSISLIEKYSALLQGRQLFTLVNKIVLAGNVIMLAVFIVWYLIDSQTVMTYLVTYIVFSFIQALIFIAACHSSDRSSFFPRRPERTEARQFFSYSMFAFVINIIQFLAYRIDYWLLDHFKDEVELGFYAQAVRLSQLFWVLPILFASIILPVVAADRKGYEQSRMHVIIRGMNLMNVIAGILAFLLAPYLIPFLFGEEFNDSIIPFQILLPGVVLFCLATVLAAWFAGRNLLKINLGGSLLCLTVITIFDFILIPSMGKIGAAIASSIGYGVTGIYFVIMYCSIGNVSFSKLFLPGKSDRHYISGILTSILTKKQA